MGDNYEKKIS